MQPANAPSHDHRRAAKRFISHVPSHAKCQAMSARIKRQKLLDGAKRFTAERAQRVPPIVVRKRWGPMLNLQRRTDNPMAIINRLHRHLSIHDRDRLVGSMRSSLEALRQGHATSDQWNDIELAYCVSREIEKKVDLKGIAGALDAFNIARLMIRSRAFKDGQWHPPVLPEEEIRAVSRLIELHADQLSKLTSAEYKRVFPAALQKMPETAKEYVRVLLKIQTGNTDAGVIFKGSPNASLENTCAAAIEIAVHRKKPIDFLFEEIEITAEPTSTVEQLVDKYNAMRLKQ